ncbi:MAG: MBL fold metallo-hydrolase [Candidatus Brocadiia bacterium]|jgi:L-ascorbate metabolism protein UlaG (beta-lactamase superfamily)
MTTESLGNEIKLLGNEGFRIRAGAAEIYIDAFYHPIPGMASAPVLRGKDVAKADLILVTHDHMDHFRPDEVAEVACRTGAIVVGPRAVIKSLARKVPADALREMEPSAAPAREPARTVKLKLPFAGVTAFRTFHGRGHNSYLVESAGLRFFHDGDNGNTTKIPVSALGRLDALLIGPWQGSGWVEFIEKLSPSRYFLMHLSEEELDEHAAGRFLPGICERVPKGLVVLRPGQSYSLAKADRAVQ